MRNQILQQVKKISRNTKRFMALGLAAIVTVMSVTSLDIMNAEAGAVPGVSVPAYQQNADGTWTYNYNTGEIFDAATHVHLFGHNVTTSNVHTHGNIMCENAILSEIGMRDGKVSYPLDYIEYSYIGSSLSGMDSTINGKLIFGPTAGANVSTVVENGQTVYQYSVDDNTKIRLVPNYLSADNLILTNSLSGNAVDIDGTLDKLATLSKGWYDGAAQTSGVVISLTDGSTPDYDMNSRYIYTNQRNHLNDHVYINLDYDTHNLGNLGTPVTLTGLDSTTTNSGIVVINIDMAGQTNAAINITEMKAYDYNGETYNNEEHSSAAFGSCRVVYNIIDSSNVAGNYQYTGKLTWMGTVYGSILAPRAEVTVGAVNGTVMAYTINHQGQESHRMDIYPLFLSANTDGTAKREYNEIRLLLTVKDVNGSEVGAASNGSGSGTIYQLYADENCTNKIASIPATEAVWNSALSRYEMIISSATVTNAINAGTLSVDTPYYLKKVDITDGYSVDYEDNMHYSQESGHVF